MKYDTPNCINKSCPNNLYGFYNCCHNTTWASDPRQCEKYIPDAPEEDANAEYLHGILQNNAE